jgi:hypothetical protein
MSKFGSINDPHRPRPGQRVRIPAYSDEFMAGAYFAYVVNVEDGVAKVRLDPPLRFSSSEGPGLVRRFASYLAVDLRPT